MVRLFLLTSGLVTIAPLGLSAGDVEWGHLSGRFVYDGAVLKAGALRVTRDESVIGPEVPDESLVVNTNNKGVANLIVYLRPPRGQSVRIHPSYERTAKATREFATHRGRFRPHILLLRTTQTMLQRNDCKLGYSARVRFIKNRPA